MAIDLSLSALKKLNSRLATGRAPTPFPQDEHRIKDYRSKVALIHADASTIRIAPKSINRALATTPLDSRNERLLLYATVSDALTDDGWYIGSVEYDDFFRRSLGLPLAKRYARSGIFIEHFTVDKVRRETGPFFLILRTWPIRQYVPLTRYLPLASGVMINKIAGSLPITREIGQILLFRCSKPIHPPKEGDYRAGNKIVKWLFRLYIRFTGKAPIWDANEPVR